MFPWGLNDFWQRHDNGMKQQPGLVGEDQREHGTKCRGNRKKQDLHERTQQNQVGKTECREQDQKQAKTGTRPRPTRNQEKSCDQDTSRNDRESKNNHRV